MRGVRREHRSHAGGCGYGLARWQHDDVSHHAAVLVTDDMAMENEAAAMLAQVGLSEQADAWPAQLAYWVRWPAGPAPPLDEVRFARIGLASQPAARLESWPQ